MSLRKEKNEFFIDLAYEWAMRGTCFSGGTEITTPDGIKKIKNLKNGDVIYAYGLDGHLYKDSVIDFFHKIDECISFSILNKKLIVSKDQLLFLERGWVKSSEIKKNDLVRISSVCDSNSITDWMMIGYFHGDGFLGSPQQTKRNKKVSGTKKVVHLCIHPESDDLWIRTWIEKNSKNKIQVSDGYAISKIASGRSKKIYVSDNNLWNKYYEYGCPVGRKKGEIKLDINKMTNEDCFGFLTGIFSAKGSIVFRKTSNKTSIVRMQLGMNWEECVQFVSLVLKRIGINHTYHKAGDKTFCIDISKAEEIIKIIDCFDFRMDSRKQSKYLVFKNMVFEAKNNLKIKNNCFLELKSKKNNGEPYYSEMRKKQIKYHFDMEKLFKFGKYPKLKFSRINGKYDNLFAYIPIQKINILPIQKVYDFSINHCDHAILANNVVSHNCLRRVYGAVIVDKEGTQVSTGYTGAPKNIPHCVTCWRQEHNIPSGSNYDKCRSVHAEMNALIQAGKKARGCSMYLAGIEVNSGLHIAAFPCYICSKMIVNSGIESVFVVKNLSITKFKPLEILEIREREALS